MILWGYYGDPEKPKHLFGSLFALGQLVFDSSLQLLTIEDLENNVKEMGFDVLKRLPLTERSFVVIAKKI